MVVTKTVCIDFDGCVVELRKWLGPRKYGPIISGAIEEMNRIKEAGYKIIIYTARLKTSWLEKYLKDNDIPFDAINENPWFEYKEIGTLRKPLADVYIDDRGITFTGDWTGMLEKIQAFKAWRGR